MEDKRNNEILRDLLLNKKAIADLSPDKLWELYLDDNLTIVMFGVVQDEIIRRLS